MIRVTGSCALASELLGMNAVMANDLVLHSVAEVHAVLCIEEST